MSSTSPAERVRAAIATLPRVDLISVSPTPLEHLPRFSAALEGPDIYVKRDDLTGLAFGGNKSRMFEFSLADALEQNADVIVSGAAVQSNYCRQLAAACAVLDLDIELYLRPVRPVDRQTVQGNHLLMRLCGADVTVLAPDADQHRTIEERVAELQASGRSPYWPRRPETIDLDAIAYVEAAVELEDQFADAGIDPSYVYVASSDTTQAGLQLGFQLLETDREVRGIHPVGGAADVGERMHDIAARAADRLGFECTLDPGDFPNDGSFVGDGYGSPTESGMAAVRQLARTEGILLDPVYTGKAMAGMCAAIEGGTIEAADGPVVFVHTGGQPALFAYAEAIAAVMN